MNTRFEFRSRVVFNTDENKLEKLYQDYLLAKKKLTSYLLGEGLDAQVISGSKPEEATVPINESVFYELLKK